MNYQVLIYHNTHISQFYAVLDGSRYRLMDSQTGQRFDEYQIPIPLVEALKTNKIPFSESFTDLDR